MQDPIEHFLSVTGFDAGEILKVSAGAKYAAVMLKNGHIGVCATLGRNVNADLPGTNISDISNRILLNAYFNAKLNYSNEEVFENDIFDEIDFSGYKNIVMVGFFGSLIEKFNSCNIPVEIFDPAKQSPEIACMEKQISSVSNAGAIILTSTSVFNGTFIKKTSEAPAGCDIFLLGPSGTLHRHMFSPPNIKMVFGALFEPFDEKVLQIIEKGYGTPHFSKYMKKVFIKR